jgi:hypothetical protein
LEERLSAHLILVFVVGALIMTGAAFILPSMGVGADPPIEQDARLLLVLVLIGVGLSNILVTRFYLMPHQLKSQVAGRREALESAKVLGCAFAIAPAVYGLVAALFTGHGLIALPFFSISMVGFYAVWSFLQEHPVPAEPDGGGWRDRERGS